MNGKLNKIHSILYNLCDRRIESIVCNNGSDWLLELMNFWWYDLQRKVSKQSDIRPTSKSKYVHNEHNGNDRIIYTIQRHLASMPHNKHDIEHNPWYPFCFFLIYSNLKYQNKTKLVIVTIVIEEINHL